MSLTTTTARERRYGIASRDLHIRRDLEERGIHRPRPREMETARCLAAICMPWTTRPITALYCDAAVLAGWKRLHRCLLARLHSLPEVPLP